MAEQWLIRQVDPATGLWRYGVDPAASGGGGITEITSTDMSVTITDPTGPTVDLSASGGLQPNILFKDFTFTEQTTAGTYTAEVTLPARSFVIDVGFWLEADWAADTVGLGFYTDDGQIGSDEDVKSGSAFQYSSKAAIEGPVGALIYPNFVAMTDAGGDTLTLLVTTTITSPPVVATGVLRCRVSYVTAPTPTAATFAP